MLAVSGGVDSMVMLDLFVNAGVADAFELELAVLHVDHGIDPDSRKVAKHVGAKASELGLPFHGEELGLGMSASETVARAARYGAYRALMERLGARYLVMAHHADDQAETILFRALRGTGLAGLAGIPIRARGGVVRPMMCATSTEIEEWASEHLKWWYEDPANRDDRHDRSWLRNELLPMMRTRFAHLDQDLRRLGRYASSDRSAWRALLQVIPELEFQRLTNGVSLSREAVRGFPKVLSIAVLRAAADEIGLVLGPDRAAQLHEFAASGASGKTFQLAPDWEAQAAFGTLRIVPTRRGETPEPIRVGVEGEGEVRWGRWLFRWTPGTARVTERRSMTTWLANGETTIRVASPGDRMRPFGGIGRRKVRKLLMEARVAVQERDHYPMIVQLGRILWIPGVCRASESVPPPGEGAICFEAQEAS